MIVRAAELTAGQQIKVWRSERYQWEHIVSVQEAADDPHSVVVATEFGGFIEPGAREYSATMTIAKVTEVEVR